MKADKKRKVAHAATAFGYRKPPSSSKPRNDKRKLADAAPDAAPDDGSAERAMAVADDAAA